MRKIVLGLVAVLTSLSCIASGVEPIQFNTVESTEVATAHLRAVGLLRFMEDVREQQARIPRIYSRYWVEKSIRKDKSLYRLALAHRAFGHELAAQIDSLSVEYYGKPEPKSEYDRLVWLLNLSKWIVEPGKFENYRLATRVESAATVPLLRVIVDLNVPEKDVESALKMFIPIRESAAIRANILYEESGGRFDVREKIGDGEKADEAFDREWIAFHKRAYDALKTLRRCDINRDGVLGEDLEKYEFYIDDDSIATGNDCRDWDLKLHKSVCVFRGRPASFNSLLEVFKFRCLVGEFPNVVVPAGADETKTYERYYMKRFKACWREHRVYPAGAASYYLAAKRNAFVDDQTRQCCR